MFADFLCLSLIFITLAHTLIALTRLNSTEAAPTASALHSDDMDPCLNKRIPDLN